MLRRLVISAAGVVTLGPALPLLAQTTGKVWRIGFLVQQHVNLVDSDGYYGPFTQGMRELGYVLGKNLLIDWRAGEGKIERLQALAAELVQLKPDVLVAQGTLPHMPRSRPRPPSRS